MRLRTFAARYGSLPISLQKRTKFVGAELIGIVFVAGGSIGRFPVLPEVGASRAFVGRSYAVAPVVTVGEAAARKTNHRWLDLPHFVDQFLADAIDVGNFRILSYPHTVVDDTTEILREVPINVRRDRA